MGTDSDSTATTTDCYESSSHTSGQASKRVTNKMRLVSPSHAGIQVMPHSVARKDSGLYRTVVSFRTHHFYSRIYTDFLCFRFRRMIQGYKTLE